MDESLEQRNSDSKPVWSEISVRYGSLKFSGKGEQDWLSVQFQTFLDAIPQNVQASNENENAKTVDAPANKESIETKFSASLASHIRNKGAAGNQTKRFLVTADWLRLRGKTSMSTTDVSKALIDNQQSRIANPADCLNKNVSKGFCEKTSEGFYITPEGLQELGYRDD